MDERSFTGVLPVLKERGWTSNDVVAKLRGLLHMKKTGHTGTLDPDAVGVLPVCLGKATKLVGYLTDTDKTYRCVMRLGITTDTEDMTGVVLESSDISGITASDVERAVNSFVGEYDQVPPMCSAKKVGGKKLYELAREGIEIERKPSRVYIRGIEELKVDASGEILRAEFTVRCSKGTYIRSLCRDIGERLTCGAAMESLVRLEAAGIGIDECITIAQVEEMLRNGEDIRSMIYPVEHFFMDCKRLDISGRDERFVRNGNRFRSGAHDGRYRVYLPDGTFAALYDIHDGEARLCRLFLE